MASESANQHGINAIKITFHLEIYEETPPFGNVCVCVLVLV